MQSSRSGPDPLDPGPAGFAHRGLHYGAAFPENSLIAFAAALETGAGIECDLRLTADNQILVFHDADAWRMCGSPLRIGGATWREVSGLRLGAEPVPTLASLFALVAGSAPILLEVKVDQDIWRWAPALKPLLADYDGRVGVMSFDPRLPRLMKTNLPHTRRGLVIRDGWSTVRRRLALWLADPQFVAVERSALRRPWVNRLRRRLPVYAWTIASSEQRVQAAVQADALIWEDDGRP